MAVVRDNSESSQLAARRFSPDTRLLAAVAATLLIASSHGCSTPLVRGKQGWLAGELQARTDHAPIPGVCPGDTVLPPDVNLDDGLTEDEAISTALANNSAFQATLAQLGMARGDAIQAALLANPNLLTFLPVGVKQWEWTLYVPIETLLLRPQRMAMADSDYQRVAEQLVQNGLNLVRDVRVAYTDLALATDKHRLAEEAVAIRQGIADLTRKQLASGDISELEVNVAEIDLRNAQATAAFAAQDAEIARGRLAAVMGIPFADEELVPDPLAPTDNESIDVQHAIDQALASRPDLRAAEWQVEAAARRLELARWQYVRFDFVADANAKGDKGYEVGPGARLDLPIFNRNQGGIARAQAELEQAGHLRDAVHDQIVLDVRTAAMQWKQALRQQEILDQSIIPGLDESLRIARKAFDGGGASYLLVLQTTTQYLDARTRALDQTAAMRRASAELERATGHRLAPPEGELIP